MSFDSRLGTTIERIAHGHVPERPPSNAERLSTLGAAIDVARHATTFMEELLTKPAATASETPRAAPVFVRATRRGDPWSGVYAVPYTYSDGSKAGIKLSGGHPESPGTVLLETINLPSLPSAESPVDDELDGSPAVYDDDAWPGELATRLDATEQALGLYEEALAAVGAGVRSAVIAMGTLRIT